MGILCSHSGVDEDSSLVGCDVIFYYFNMGHGGSKFL